jgi:hypothetical protein
METPTERFISRERNEAAVITPAARSGPSIRRRRCGPVVGQRTDRGSAARSRGDSEAPIIRRAVGLARELIDHPRRLSQHRDGFVVSDAPLWARVQVENAGDGSAPLASADAGMIACAVKPPHGGRERVAAAGTRVAARTGLVSLFRAARRRPRQDMEPTHGEGPAVIAMIEWPGPLSTRSLMRLDAPVSALTRPRDIRALALSQGIRRIRTSAASPGRRRRALGYEAIRLNATSLARQRSLEAQRS